MGDLEHGCNNLLLPHNFYWLSTGGPGSSGTRLECNEGYQGNIWRWSKERGWGLQWRVDYGDDNDNLEDQNDDAIDVLLQIVKDNDDNLPSDYVEPEKSGLVDQPTVTTDIAHKNCAEYTQDHGYECVPYYQCQNGTIITDGAGLIDIRNGFGSLSVEDSKCPGFLDACCKDPDFVAPPPPKIKYAPKCGRRNQNGLGVRIQVQTNPYRTEDQVRRVGHSEPD